MLEVHGVTKSPSTASAQSMGSDVAQRGGQPDNAQVRFFLLPLHTPLQFLAPASIQILISHYYVGCNVFKAKLNFDWFVLFLFPFGYDFKIYVQGGSKASEGHYSVTSDCAASIAQESHRWK